MNRLVKEFQRSKDDRLTVYFTAGYPTLNSTFEIIQSLEKSGTDIIEIGMPYSDPLADGPTIQNSSEIALKNGMTLDVLFDQLRGVRKSISIPLVLMGYYNQVLQYGIEKFCKYASECGIDGLILPDLPLEEYESNCKELFAKYDLTHSFLVTPISSPERVKMLDKASSGFLYVVSSNSITGGTVSNSMEALSKRLKELQLKSAMQVGFGISSEQKYREANHNFDGAIIGSAFIKALDQNRLQKSIMGFVEKIKN